MADVMGKHGIFCSDGATWARQRKLASRIFSANKFRTHVQRTVLLELERFERLLQSICDKRAPVNLPDIFFRFTLNSFALMAFDADMECLPSNVEALAIPNAFAVSFDYAQMVMDHRVFALLPRWCEQFTAEGRQMRKAMQTINTYSYDIIDKRLAQREKAGVGNATDKQGKDLLDLFIDNGLTRKELLPVILNFFIAARDTTAQSLAWLSFTSSGRSPSV